MNIFEKLKASGVELYEVDGMAKFIPLRIDDEEFVKMVTNGNGVAFWFTKIADFSGDIEKQIANCINSISYMFDYSRCHTSMREGDICEEYWEDALSSVINRYEKELEEEAERFLVEYKEERLFACFTVYKGVTCGVIKEDSNKQENYEDWKTKLREIQKKYENECYSLLVSLQHDLRVAYKNVVADLEKGLRDEHKNDLLLCKNQMLRKRFVRQLIEAYSEEYDDCFSLKIPMGRIQEEAEEVVRLHRSSQNGI